MSPKTLLVVRTVAVVALHVVADIAVKRVAIPRLDAALDSYDDTEAPLEIEDPS